MPIPLFTLIVVLILIALRKLGPLHLRIWVIMLIGALFVLFTGQISWTNAWRALDFNILGYLFGVFVLGQALEESGFLKRASYYFFRLAKGPRTFILLIFLLLGFGSAILMNDTVAIMATPILLHIARDSKIDVRPLLLALAYAVTIGSVMSPVGNPQNLLIAIKGPFQEPFIAFFSHLFIPTVICLFVGVGFILWFYRRELAEHHLDIELEPMNDMRLARISQVSLLLLVLLIILKIITGIWPNGFTIKFSWIAIISALPILLFSRRRWRVVKQMDWGTMVFFATMFVLMQSVWDAGVFQSIVNDNHLNITTVPAILSISATVSQLISNIPLVVLYLPLLLHHGATTQQLLALAAGSTIAGNFLIMGAASNVIIIQNCESRGEHGFSFLEFAKVGIPLGLVNLLVYWLFLG